MPKACPSISIKAQVAVYAINERSGTLLKYLHISSLYLNESRFGAPERSWFLKKIKNNTFAFHKNIKIYSLNTYTCFEYLCEVSVEISLYFELLKKNKFVATYRLKFCQKFVFFV
jgi:hypothetical protein